MTPSVHHPRLALARPAQHPLAETVRKAGWRPIPYSFTVMKRTGAAPPTRALALVTSTRTSFSCLA